MSSVTVMSMLKTKEFLPLILIVFSTLAIAVFVLLHLWKAKERKTVVFIFTIGIICLFPAALLTKVSELYIYNAMPFFALLVGIAFGNALMRFNEKVFYKKVILILFIAALCLSNSYAVYQKVNAMQRNGERANIILKNIIPFVHQIPKGGKLFLLNSPSTLPEYSVFQMNGFNVLGLNRIYHLSGRTDFEMKIIGENQLDSVSHFQKTVILSLNDTTVYNYKNHSR